MNRASRILGAALALALVAASPSPTDPSPQKQAITALQADDARLQSIGWRLARGNAAFCRDTAPAVGLLLYDVRNFAGSEAVRAALGLTGDFAVGAVAA